MILNSKNNNFVPNFPKNFFYESVKERYAPIVERLPLPYDSLTDYLNASIQQFSFPSINVDTVSQTLNDEFVEWKDGFRMGKAIDKSFTVTFKNYEGYINYWMMFDQFEEFLNKYQKNKFLPNISVRLLDHHGFELLSIEYHQVLMTGISDLELNFTSNTAEFESFTCDFKYNYYQIKRRTPIKDNLLPSKQSAVRDISHKPGNDLKEAIYTIQYENGTVIESGSIPCGGSKIINVPNPDAGLDANWVLEDTNGNVLDSGVVESGGSVTIFAPNSNVTNSSQSYIETITSGGELVLPDTIYNINIDGVTVETINLPTLDNNNININWI